MILLYAPYLAAFFLFAVFILTINHSCVIRLGRFKSKELFQKSILSTFFFERILKRFSSKNHWESFLLTQSFAKHLFSIAYACFGFIFLLSSTDSSKIFQDTQEPSSSHHLFLLSIYVIVSFLVFDFLARVLSSIKTEKTLKLFAPLSFSLIILSFPIVGILLKIAQKITSPFASDENLKSYDKTRLKEMIKESELKYLIDLSDQKLIASFINFKNRVAKEIMVPRVDLFSLSSDTTIQEASHLFTKEGYSRIPVYKETLDNILGVVLYKDLLKQLISNPNNINNTLETITKPVLYAPENKKISQLLQEFRTKQIHMAIIVDEYGGTEGIVTIEDILEELVGEIEDEYDIDEEHTFTKTPEGAWIIDAKMTLLDIEDQIGIHIPTHPEYETLGGYVYHCAGTIPSRGWKISHDKFELEVLSSNERAIKKIKIVPRV